MENKTYKQLIKEVSKEYGWNTSTINGNIVFWIPWEETGAFRSLEDAQINAINLNEKNQVSWCYSKDDLIELLTI